MAEEVKDGTTEVVKDSSTTGDTKPSEPDEKTKAALEAGEKLTSLLGDHGFDSVEDLTEALSKSVELKESLKDLDLGELKDKAEELDRVHAYWASEKESKKRDEEEPDDTTARLDKELKELRQERADDKARTEAIKESESALSGFNDEVSSFLEKQDDLPEEYRPFAEMLMGINNPANEIDITNKTEIRKMCSKMAKTFKDLEGVIGKRLKEGKVEIPTMSKTEATAPITDETKPKNLKEARKITIETLTKKFLGK